MQRRLVSRLAPALWLAVWAWPATSSAQYTVPGTLAELPEDRKQAVEKAADEARYHLGPFRVSPILGLRDAGYLYEEKPQPDGSSDLEGYLTATATAGLRAYLRTGSHLVWVLHGRGDYVYRDSSEVSSELFPVFGAGLFGDAGRLGVEVTATRADSWGIATSETLQRTSVRDEQMRADFDLRLGRSLIVRFGGGQKRYRVLQPDKPTDDPLAVVAQQLDRDQTTAAAGLVYKLRSGLAVGLGYETSDTEFVATRDRSNDGDGIVATVDYPGRSLALSARVARQSLTGKEGSSFGTFEGTTGRLQVGLRPGRRFSPRLYAFRELEYTLTLASPYTLSERAGASLNFAFGRRTTLALFAESGTESYRTATGSAQGREDDLSAWGARAMMDLGRGFRFVLGYSLTSYTSNRPELDRDQREVTGGLTYGLGGGPGLWY